MATYPQWARGAAAGKTARLMWLCGPEQVLADEVEAVTRTAWLGKTEILMVLSAADTAEGRIWDALTVQPSGTGLVVVVVHAAQHLKDFSRLIWVAEHVRQLPHLRLLLRTSDDDFPRQGKVLASHLAALQATTAGQLVRCAPLNDKDVIAWVQHRVPVDDSLAWHIWQVSGHSLAEAAAICAKASLFASVTSELVDQLASGETFASFATALLSGDKRAALSAVPEPGALGGVVGMLSSRLDLLGKLFAAGQEGLRPAEMRTRLRLPPFLIAQWSQVAGDYSPARVARRRQVLATADSAWRQGAREGVAEYIATMW